MYLTRSARALCYLGLFLGLFFALPAFFSSRDGVEWGFFVFAIIFLAPSVYFLSNYYFSEARKREPRARNIFVELKLGGFGGRDVSEFRGVQMCVLPFPDLVRPPSFFALAFFLQNCHSTPRKVTITTRAPFRWIPLQAGGDILLSGAEAGVFLLVAPADLSQTEGEVTIPFSIEAQQTQSVGARVIWEEGRGLLIRRGKGAVLVPCGKGSSSVSIAAYAGLQQLAGYRMIFKPGMERIDLQSLAFMKLTG